MSLRKNARRYTEWDGTQAASQLDPDAVLGALSDELLEHGDLRTAMRNLLRRGLSGDMPMQGLRDLAKQLREQRKQRLDRFDLSSAMKGFAEALDEVVALERDALDAMDRPARDETASPTDNSDDSGDRLRSASRGNGDEHSDADTTGQSDRDPSSDDDPHRNLSDDPLGSAGADLSGEQDASAPPSEEFNFARSVMGDIASRQREFLDALPADVPGKVKQLQSYDFTSPEAQAKFEALLDQLRDAMSRSLFRDIEKMVNDMSPEDMQRMKDMMRDLNEMLVKHISGDDAGFDEFMEKYGDFFGPNPPNSVEELVDQMQQQMAAMQSLMMSMPTSQFEQLQELLQDRFSDKELNDSMRSLAQKLDFLDPNKGQRYQFGGEEELDLRQAMDLMDEMHELEKLEQQLTQAVRDGDLDGVDEDKLEELLGPEAKDALAQMREMTDLLEQAGYISRDGDQFDLTPRGMRMIGRQALGEIYRTLKRQSLGNHQLPEEGRFGERLDATKPYEFGDPFHLHMPRTLGNALRRNGLGTPVDLSSEDFEVYRHEQATKTSTVLLVDLSWSMELRGAFPSAKRVALALNNLITSAFPRDSFHVVGFSAYARELKAHEVPFLTTDEYVMGTNMHHALLIAEQLLDRDHGGTKQVLMITDGEPTAHIENGGARFAYPPSPRTIRETLRAVKRCTKKRITINTFMLDESYYLRSFMDEVSKINGGRVFYSSPGRLGEYVLVDYVQNKRKILGRR